MQEANQLQADVGRFFEKAAPGGTSQSLSGLFFED